MGLILWIIFGALVGWIASLIMHTDQQQGAIANIIVGVVGSLIGGGISRLLGGVGITGFNFGSLLLAIIGAVVLLFFVRLLSGGRGRTTTISH